MKDLGIEYEANQWRLFIDSSKSALKAVLLFHDNSLKPVPVFYGIEMKEEYDTIKDILEKINYAEHNWRLSCDLKVVALVSGMQGGWTKFNCFICQWDSRFDSKIQYQTKIWPRRDRRRPGYQNIANDPLIPVENILLPPLHIK